MRIADPRVTDTPPTVSATLRADGYWIPKVGKFHRGSVFTTEDAALHNARRYVELNWGKEKDA